MQSSSSLTGATKAPELSTASGALNDTARVDETVTELAKPGSTPAVKQQKASGINVIDGFLNLISSVPFGIIQLILLITACMIGMLIQQHELETFAAYYAELTPAEKVIYGRLGFFDIYHAWYFNLLLLLLSLNIILASIDHFPAAWSHISRKKLTASPLFAMAQRFKEKLEIPSLGRKQLVERAAEAARAMKFKVRVTEEESRTTIFAERGVWNRLGAYVVHIGLLTIFLGGFLTSRGFTGMARIIPDESTDKMVQNVYNVEHATTRYAISPRELALPFTLEGIDIQQKLIKKEGTTDPSNTLDWLTRIRIHDHETGQKTEALVHMNHPFDYRGYRFFQSSGNQIGSARTINLKVTPAAGGTPQEITIQRNGEAKLADGTRLKYYEFNPHFILTPDGKITLGSAQYMNPAAHLIYIKPDGQEGELWAFTQGAIDEISNDPDLKTKFLNTGQYQFALTDFEKVWTSHDLSVQYDPGARVVYIGFTILCLTLIAVFFFSHQRLWIVVEDGKVFLGGDANRNRLGFEDRVKKVIALIQPQHTMK
ncbi:MAG: cytochrome c biogenesis protein ResB [Acidobacteria bacterium]|nr:cytochrome c biogenesis protein ResB [Acidobacteriota bacterium]